MGGLENILSGVDISEKVLVKIRKISGCGFSSISCSMYIKIHFISNAASLSSLPSLHRKGNMKLVMEKLFQDVVDRTFSVFV